MGLTITSALSFFVLICISTVIYFLAKRFKVPYTVLLVFFGLLLVPIANHQFLETSIGFLDDLMLSPALLFYIFLPILIFECAFNMRIRQMVDNIYTISALSIIGLLISVLVIAGLLYFTLPLIGIQIPFIIALLFGAVISPTDPVAVLALFKECKAPKRLSIIFEGESLFNDGTAMALFMVLLAIATTGFNGAETVSKGVFDFAVMIILGVIFGLALAAIISRALRWTKSNEFVTITLILISAHIVFILSELINHSGVIHVSSIIATTVAALYLGNYSRHILAPRVDEYLSKLIEHMAFIANSLVFLMAGLLFASTGVDFAELWLPILISVFIVAFARLIAVYAVVRPLNVLNVEAHVPASWQKLLSWGSLRGALSIIIVLLIPEDFTIDGWALEHTPRDFLLALTIGCILATLFIKAPLIVPLMKKFNIKEIQPLKEAHEADLSLYYLMAERKKLLSYKVKGFLSENHYQMNCECIESRLAHARAARELLLVKYGQDIFEQSLHLAVVHVERLALKKLFMNEEVNETVYRKINGKLLLQQEKIEMAQHDQIDPKLSSDRKDIFDIMVRFVHSSYKKSNNETINSLEHYRAQMIIARKAIETIEHMQNEFGEPVFLPHAFETVIQRYRTYKERSKMKMDALVEAHKDMLEPHLKKLAARAIESASARALSYLRDHGLVDEQAEEDIHHAFAAPVKQTH